MTRNRIVFFVLSATLAAAPAAYAQRLPPDIKVTTTIADMAGEQPLRIGSDLQGAYVTKVVSKVMQVESILQATPNGYDFMLSTYYTSKGSILASNRTVFVDLRDQVRVGTIATPALGYVDGAPVLYGRVTAQFSAKCSRVNVDVTKMAEGATIECPGALRFRAPNNSWYRLSFQPDNYAAVDRINVTCTTADATGCRVWMLTPAGTGLTTLLSIDSAGTVVGVGGDFLVSYSVTVAR
jgi:hypothetical protein